MSTSTPLYDEYQSTPDVSLSPTPSPLMEPPFPLLDFPLEILLMIANFLPTRHLSLLSRTCRTLHDTLSPLLALDFESQAARISRYATRHNNPALLARALAFYNPSQAFGGYFMLRLACKHGFEQVVRLLLQHGAPMRRAPLQRALETGKLAIARILLDNGADWEPFGMVDSQVEDGECTVVERLLMEYGARRDGSGYLVKGGEVE